MKASVCLVALATLFASPIAFAHESDGEATEAAPFGAPVDDEHVFTHVLLNQFEGRFGSGSAFRWSGEAWAGTDTDRVWLRSEGEAEAEGGDIRDGQQELFYARPISTYFNLQAGVRYDLDSGPGRGWLAFGVEGLAPYFFNVAATGYIGESGRLAAKFEASYDLLLTQRLILQPEIEMNFYSKSDPARLIGSGLSDIDAGLRLRYEIVRKFAPYIGVSYERKFGETADFATAHGERADDVRLTVGVRMWL